MEFLIIAVIAFSVMSVERKITGRTFGFEV